MNSEFSLSGCRPEPLGWYLKALRVLKLVAMRVDPTAIGHWHGNTFTLGTVLSWDDLIGFPLGKYQPTPVVSP